MSQGSPLTGPSLGKAADSSSIRETQRLSEDFVARALGDAPRSDCPASSSLFVISTSTGKAFPIACDRWLCPSCGRKKAQLAKLVIEAGILLAIEANIRCRYIVLSSLPQGADVDQLRDGWNRLRQRLRDRGHYESFVRTVEIKAGRPHLNVITVGGKSIPQRELSKLAERAGLGPSAYIKAVGTSERDADQLADYVVKAPTDAVRWAVEQGRHSLQPICFSTRWKPFRLTEASKQLREALGYEPPQGPFVRVRFDGERAKILGRHARRGRGQRAA